MYNFRCTLVQFLTWGWTSLVMSRFPFQSLNNIGLEIRLRLLFCHCCILYYSSSIGKIENERKWIGFEWNNFSSDPWSNWRNQTCLGKKKRGAFLHALSLPDHQIDSNSSSPICQCDPNCNFLFGNFIWTGNWITLGWNSTSKSTQLYPGLSEFTLAGLM